MREAGGLCSALGEVSAVLVGDVSASSALAHSAPKIEAERKTDASECRTLCGLLRGVSCLVGMAPFYDMYWGCSQGLPFLNPNNCSRRGSSTVALTIVTLKIPNHCVFGFDLFLH